MVKRGVAWLCAWPTRPCKQGNSLPWAAVAVELAAEQLFRSVQLVVGLWATMSGSVHALLQCVLVSRVYANVGTCLQVLQFQIPLAARASRCFFSFSAVCRVLIHTQPVLRHAVTIFVLGCCCPPSQSCSACSIVEAPSCEAR